MTELDPHFVYLIAHMDTGGAPIGPVKVGYTRYPDKRLAALQTGNPAPLHIVFRFQAPSKELARQAEGIFHDVARDLRLSGEWFDMSPELGLNTLTKCLIGVISEDITDPASLASLLEWSGVWSAADLWAELSGVPA